MAVGHNPAAVALTDLILKIFRLNGRLLDVADRITEGSGLTAARWQVLGAVLRQPLSVADVARSMGLSRQSVQRLADVLVEEGLCAYQDNPAHRRAKLLTPAPRGWAEIHRIAPIQIAWANRVGVAVGEKALRATNATVDALLETLAEPVGQVDPPSARASDGRAGKGGARPSMRRAGRRREP